MKKGHLMNERDSGSKQVYVLVESEGRRYEMIKKNCVFNTCKVRKRYISVNKVLTERSFFFDVSIS
jgi:hypothetical protein